MRNQETALTLDQRRVMVDYLSRTLDPRNTDRVRDALSELRPSDLISVMAVFNMAPVRSLGTSPWQEKSESIVVPMLLQNDISMIRLIADNERLVSVERAITAKRLIAVLHGLRAAGIIDSETRSHPSIRKHAKVAVAVQIGGVNYADELQFMVFIEENLFRFEEVFSYIEENGAYDVGVLRAISTMNLKPCTKERYDYHH